MRKRYKPQRIGLNPEWFEIYIFKPLAVVLLFAVVITSVFLKYRSYAADKAIKESEQRIIQESIAAEEKAIAESKKAKEEEKLEKERQRESLAMIEVETRRINTLYENTISQKVCPIGTYLKNSELKKVGRVVGYYGLEVKTNNDWNFNIDTNGTIPEEITMIGYAEYTKSLKAQKEREEKRYKKENAIKLQQLIDEELAEQTRKTKEFYGKNTDHLFITYHGKKYKVMEIKGNELIILEKGKKWKKSNYETIDAYDSDIKVIPYIDYEINR